MQSRRHVSIHRTALHLNMNDKFISHGGAQRNTAFPTHHLVLDGGE